MRQERNSAESRLGLPEYRGHTLAERSAFAVLILFVGAAAVGAFGGGPASEATAESDNGKLQIQYERFLRRDAPEVMDLIVPTAAGERNVEVTFDAEYLRRLQITEVFPQPAQSSWERNGKLRFDTDGSGEPIQVRLHYQARLPGVMTTQVVVASAGEPAQARIKQLVYP